ncbi:MAG TPA: SCO family protein [Ramlibacter sp.]|nr:SCO family protein [Ramlibacter sp.]
MIATARALMPALTALLVFVATVIAGWPGNAKAAGDAPWGANYFPNVPLITQDGKKVRFFDDLIKGKVVAINFIFTGCSESCSMETARLREVQDLLADRMGKDIFFVSISIDPDNDTPEALKHYADKFKVGPGWTFLTGKNEDITLLRDKLGIYMPPVVNGKSDHELSLVVGNQATGRWMKASPYENPQIMATTLGSWLHNWKVIPANKNDTYANAPTRVPELSRGEELYRTRCASCHSIGAPANSLAALRAIGPDLAGITQQRDRAWLTRWLKEPDRMLAEKDPLATALYLKYNKLAMPNLRLNDKEVAQVLTFLEEHGKPPTAEKKVARQ